LRVRDTPYLTIIRPEHGWNLAVYASWSTSGPLSQIEAAALQSSRLKLCNDFSRDADARCLKDKVRAVKSLR
jgi:hypothetical protein